MAADVTSAWIAAAAAGVTAGFNIVFTLRTERKRRDAELLVHALEYFQGSQRRGVGIAALRVLQKRDPATWTDYRETVAYLFYRQLLYLFTDGENRWKAHEISNIEGMAEWLLCDERPRLDSKTWKQMRQHLCEAMTHYEQTWANPEIKKRDPDRAAVEHLLHRIEEWKRAPLAVS